LGYLPIRLCIWLHDWWNGAIASLYEEESPDTTE
jgi:hypothetical protein